MAKSLTEQFLDDYSTYIALGVKVYRYGNEYLALIAHENALGKWIENLNDENGESDYELWGLGLTEWFPLASGETIASALENLDVVLAKTKGHWEVVSHALDRLRGEKLERRRMCVIRTVDQLLADYHAWEGGGPDSMLVPRPGFK